MTTKIPRLVIAAPGSGCGKTIVTLALAAAFKRTHTDVVTYKVGPDYIDPMFHAEVFGRRGFNLDLYLGGEEQVKSLFARTSQGHNIALTEGVMGLYDGLGGVSTKCSTWDTARAIKSPTLLVLDCRQMSVSSAAAAAGFASYKKDALQGFILNGAPAEAVSQLKKRIEKATGLPVLGHLPYMPEASFESRHLGLLAPSEIDSIQRSIVSLGQAFFLCSDMPRILELAASAPELTAQDPDVPRLKRPVRIAWAHDEAFSFFYRSTLDLLEDMHCELVPFSPMKDRKLPDNCGGLLLGGGYAELHAQELSENVSMREAIADAVRRRMPTIAESGGFLYLHEKLADPDGTPYPMAGILAGTAERGAPLSKFGYVKMTAQKTGMLHPMGATFHAHSIHYWTSPNPGDDFVAEKPKRKDRFRTGHATASLYAAFPHLFLAGHPDAAWRFVNAASQFVNR